MFKAFRDFIARGNVIDLAVAVIIGTAFNAVVTSLVNDIIMPIIGILLGGVDFSGLSATFGGAVVAYGKFIQAIVNFLIISFTIFLILQAYKRLRKREEEGVVEPKKEELPRDVVLLTEIRDILQNGSTGPATEKPRAKV